MKKNQNVSIEIEAVADLIVEGVVERIAPQATIKSGIKGFSTKIKLQKSIISILALGVGVGHVTIRPSA